MSQKRIALSNSSIKIIACVFMLIDHIGAILVERKLYLPMQLGIGDINEGLLALDVVLRSIGRIAFPLFCFLLVEGFYYTHSKLKYIRNLGMLAIISEIPFDYAFFGGWNGQYQNVFFTLLIGVLAMYGFDWIKEKGKTNFICLIGYLFITLFACGSVATIGGDYSIYGILCIVVIYFFREKPVLSIGLACAILCLLSITELPAFLAMIPVALYNHQRGLSLKYAFYLFYPLHIVLLYDLSLLIFQQNIRIG